MSCYDKALEQKKILIEKGLLENNISILSYGGGVNSSALLFYIFEKNIHLDLVIFSDTGEELDETYKSVEDMKIVCKNNNIPFVTVKSHFGSLYDYYFKRKAVPEMMRRGCTSKFKISPIRKYLRETFGKQVHFFMYIGIASDEAKRVTVSDVKYMTYVYPFVDDNISRKDNINILKKNNFVASKSGCKGCPFLKKKEWINMFNNNPKEFDRWLKLEENNRRFPEITLNGNFALRVIKENWKNQTTLDKFSDNELSCNGGCFL